jgi:hypothetical protein
MAWKAFQGLNTLANYEHPNIKDVKSFVENSNITDVKCFVMLAPGVDVLTGSKKMSKINNK